MQRFVKTTLASAITFAVSHAALAGTAPFFVPLTNSTPVGINNPTTAMHPTEATTPFAAPAGIGYKILTSMKEIEADATQSTQRTNAGGFGSAENATMWDMLAYDNTGRYIYIPHETQAGAGVSRYDTQTDKTKLIFAGDSLGLGANGGNAADDDWSDDFGAFDPARWTPNGTVIAGEEWAGLGRVVEIMNPLATPSNPIVGAGNAELVEGTHWRVLKTIASVSQEGINYSLKQPNKVIYYIDEDNSGSIYKFVMQTAGDYAGKGQTFVLAVNAFAGNAAASYNAAANTGQPRVGAATWVAITDADGVPTTVANAFAPTNTNSRPGRAAADEVNGTPYGRPEDVAVSKLANGNEAVYFAATSENAVYSIEEMGGNNAMVRLFASDAVTPKNKDFLPTTGRMNSPDNLAIDALGNIYIIEDSPNSGREGGDTWFARDMNNDGVAESIDHFLSLSVAGSEATGLIFHPKDPSRFVIAVQHPTSTNLTAVPGGLGDAIWEFDVAKVVPPTCEGPRSNWMTFDQVRRNWVRACSSSADFNFVNQLEAFSLDFPNP